MRSTLESSGDFPGAFYAMQLLQRKEYANAITALETVIGDAEETDLVQFAEIILQSNGILASDIERLEKLLQSVDRPKDANVISVIVARLRESRGFYTGAEAIYRQLLVESPNDAVVLNNLANLFALSGTHLDEALSMINKAIELEGPTPLLLDTRGVCHLSRKDIDSALKDLKQSVAEFPHPLLRFHLAWALAESGNTAAATAELKAALNPDLTSTLHVLERDDFARLVQELAP
jgi:tetratricopeptide (TPR) repeat protein